MSECHDSTTKRQRDAWQGLQDGEQGKPVPPDATPDYLAGHRLGTAPLTQLQRRWHEAYQLPLASWRSRPDAGSAPSAGPQRGTSA